MSFFTGFASEKIVVAEPPTLLIHQYEIVALKVLINEMAEKLLK